MKTQAAEERTALQAEVDRMSSSLANMAADGRLGSRPGAFQHHARVLRQARARLLAA